MKRWWLLGSILVMWLSAPVVVFGSGSSEVARMRGIVDALLDWDLSEARWRLAAWEASGDGTGHARALYAAAIAVAEADYAPSRDPDKYDVPLKRLHQAIDRANRQLARTPGDASARGVRATAKAIAGRLLMEQGHWLRAYRMGRSSRNEIRRLLQEDPGFADGYLIMGLFEYFTGTIPGVLRWLAALVDFSGDRQLGIDYLERCVRSAPVAAPQAADALLLEVAFTDLEACRYRSLAALMTRRYPHNPRYRAARRRLGAQCDRVDPARRPPPGHFVLAPPPLSASAVAN